MQSVMFISLGFYDYDQKIRDEIQKLGYNVTQFTPMGKLNSFEKLLMILTKDKYLTNKCLRRQKKYLLKNTQQYDYVLVIVGRHLDPSVLEEYRKQQKNSKFILYLWDDVARVEHFEENKKNYDEIYSIDLRDVEKYHFKHLPLFYVSDYCYSGEEKKYVLSLSGQLHSDRLSIWDKIVTKNNLNIEKCFLYLLGGSIKNHIRAHLPSKDRWMKSKYIHMRTISLKDAAHITKQSKTTLDVQFKSQAGLTIRTFESLASHTKLITTNSYVKEYDFYKYGNICVIDRENPSIPEGFFDEPYHEVPEEITNQYSLANWLRTMLESSGTEVVDTQEH